MTASNAMESGIAKLVYQAVAWSLYADNTATTPQTSIATGLHTADPLSDEATGTMSTSEVAYTSYARVDVARTTGGWAESSGVITPVAAISFPAGTGGSGTVTHFSTGETGGGAKNILAAGTVTPNIVCGDGITPQLTTSTTITFD